jgi:hypothetical protein
MNKIDTTQIVDPNVLQPFPGPSLEFLQDATAEMLKVLGSAFVGESFLANVPYALIGVTYTGTAALPASVLPGYILFNNEIFGVNSGFGPAALGAQFNLVTTQGTPDPLTFSDLSAKNVHNIRKLQITDAAPGGGLFDLTDVIYIQTTATQTATLLASFTGTVQYYRDGKGFVYFRGLPLLSTTPSTGTVIFQLAAGFRPAATKNLSGVATTNSGDTRAFTLQIATGGNCTVIFAPVFSGASSFPLDGLFFNVNW